jgi:Tol biopolymer transport system component
MKESHASLTFVCVGLVLLPAVALVACGGSGATDSAPPAASPSGAAAALSASASPSVIPLPTPTVAGTIAFTRYRGEQGEVEVCTVNTDGTGLRVLAGDAQYPSWSPDGKRIAYCAGDILRHDWHVWVMNADGSGKVQLTERRPHGGTPQYNMWPSWSPDGKQIVFVDPSGNLIVMNADGSGARRVTRCRMADYWPTWGKDGRITFYRPGSDGFTLGKFSVDPDGSGLTRLSKEAGASEWLWVKHELGPSPDGRWVARHDVEADRLVIVPVGGGGYPVTLLNPVTAYAEGQSAAEGPLSPAVDVAWSPDGKALAIAGQSETNFSRLYIVNADGTGLSAVPGVDAAESPAWRPE